MLDIYTDKGQIWWTYIWGKGGRVYAYIRKGVRCHWEGKTLQFAICWTYYFFQYKARISAYFTSCKMWNMLKDNNKDARISKVNNKSTAGVVLVSSLSTLNSVSIVEFDQLISGWGCRLLFWPFVPAGINLGEVSTYGETR